MSDRLDSPDSSKEPIGLPRHFAVEELRDFAGALLAAAGLDPEKSSAVAEALIEADMLGHWTHGLQLLDRYIDELLAGRMTATGEPTIVSDRGACVTWDGNRLPGPWLVMQALDMAMGRVQQYGTVTVVIRRSHHIACLASYLRRATDNNLAVLIMSSEPSGRTVVPYGGTRPVVTTNPIAAGWPTDAGPILMDLGTSITNMGLCRALKEAGHSLPGAWLVDADGAPSDDPAALFTDPPGSIMPFGGVDHGHKGYALSLLVEMLTSGLAGFGRADPREGWTASVFIQVIDPEAFSGIAPFQRETGWLANESRQSPTAPWYREKGNGDVRLPGDAALARRQEALSRGVALTPGVMERLRLRAAELAIAMPGSLEPDSIKPDERSPLP